MIGPYVIGLVGPMGAGKSTVAQRLIERHGFQLVKFAGPLKDMLRALGLTDEHLEGRLKEQPCDLLGGRTPRHAMQSLGTEWGRDLIASDLWIRAWEARVARAGNLVVVDDCRFANEFDAVLRRGELWRVTRPGAAVNSHVSETAWRSAPARLSLENAGSVGALNTLVDQLAWSIADTEA